MKDKRSPLSPQQEAFIQAYRKNGRNQRHAYLEAYPKSRKWRNISNVDSAASRLMADGKVIARLRELDKSDGDLRENVFKYIDSTLDQLIEMGIKNIDPEKMRWADVVSMIQIKAKMHGVDTPPEEE